MQIHLAFSYKHYLGVGIFQIEITMMINEL